MRKEITDMKVAVYDTYVPKHNGGIMHFDIIVADGLPYEKVLGFGKAYLKRRRSRRTTVKREGM